MTKRSLRTLALGFFLSGSLVVGFRYFDDNSEGADNQEIEELQNEIRYLEEQLAQFEVAQATAEQDLDETLETEEEQEIEPEEESNDSEEDSQEEEEEQPEEENPEESEEDSEEEAEEVFSATITVGEGQPSSVAARQLQEQGIIEDRFDFDSYLENNNYAVLVRPGSYEVSSDMNYEEIANTLMGR